MPGHSGRYSLMMTPSALVLMDNRQVLTVMMHPISYSWRDENAKGNLIDISNVSVVIRKP